MLDPVGPNTGLQSQAAQCGAVVKGFEGCLLLGKHVCVCSSSLMGGGGGAAVFQASTGY